MKRIVLFSLALFWGLSFVQASQGTLVRTKKKFNEHWKFILDDNPVFCETDFDDASWRDLSLPHDWSVDFEFSKSNSGRNAWLPGGVGWYRKSFVVPADLANKNVEIQFDGVYKNATVWINEHPVGAQYDGYTSFRFDISELLLYGQTNTIAVRVDNSIQPNCRWYSGSGIYRNVWLNIVGKTHIETWGTYITTPVVGQQEAEIRIQNEIQNMDEQQELIAETVIYDPAGIAVAKVSSDFSMGRFSRKTLTQSIKVPQPQLWSVSQPMLYLAVTTLKKEEMVLDEYRSSFGIRTIEFDAEKGFFLNGKNMKMKGVCLHHDVGPLGAAVPDEVWVRRLTELKKLGCNAIRTSHNPPSPEFLDLCDKMGFLVMDEFVDKWENAYKRKGAKKNPYFDVPFADPLFSVEWRKNYRETIRRDRNHPSIVIWSVGNENHAPGSIGQNNGLRNYASFVRSLDPTRPVISGMERGTDKPVNEKVADIIKSCTYMDLIGMNYGEQWCKLIADRKPGKPFVSTESYTYYNSELEKRFAPIERAPWLDVMDNDFNMGLFLWVGIDYLGESKTWGNLGSGSGLLDMAGFRKNRSYLYEAFWSEKPMVHIEVYKGDADDLSPRGSWGWPETSQNWNLKKGTVVDLATYTNCEEVDLFLNGKKIGTQKLSDFPNWIMKWRDIGFHPGTLRAVGKIDGKVVCESRLVSTGKPHQINLSCYEDEVKAGGVVHVEVELVDNKGFRVQNDDRDLSFSVEGDAEILGLTNGDMQCLVPFTNKNSRPSHSGRCLCIIKMADAMDRPVRLIVTGDGLKTASIKLR